MADMKVSNGRPYGNDFIFCQRRYSSEAYRTAGLAVAKQYAIGLPDDITTDQLLAIGIAERQETIGQLATRSLSSLTLPVRNYEL